jgi:hypothetical protein
MSTMRTKLGCVAPRHRRDLALSLSCTIRVQLVTPAAIRATNSRNNCIFKLTQCAAHWRHHRACFPATLFKAFLGCAQRCLPGAARVELAAVSSCKIPAGLGGAHWGCATCCATRRDTHWQAVEWVPASSWDMPAYTAMSPEPFEDIWP